MQKQVRETKSSAFYKHTKENQGEEKEKETSVERVWHSNAMPCNAIGSGVTCQCCSGEAAHTYHGTLSWTK